MRDLKCDVCGTTVKAEWELMTLSAEANHPDVRDVCEKCGKQLNETYRKVTRILLHPRKGIVQRFIETMRKAKP